MPENRLGARCSVVLVLLTACVGEADQDRFSVTAGDPARTVTIERPSQHLQGTADLIIGERGDDEGIAFGRVTGLAIGSGGRLFVADGLEHRIGVFSQGGDLEFWIGRKGSGPGEMISPCCLSFGPGGLLWVRDNGNGRLQAFEVEGGRAEYRHSVPAAGNSSRGPAISFTADGNVVDVRLLFSPRGFVSQRFVIDTRTGDVLRIDEIPVPSPDRVPVIGHETRTSMRKAGAFFQPLFGPRHLIAHGPEANWAEAISTEYTLLRYVQDSLVLRMVRDVDPGPPLTAAERKRAAAAWRRMMTEMGRLREASDPRIPERKPVLSDLFFDAEGRLWAVLEAQPGGSCEADVIEPDGSYGTAVIFPCGIDLTGGAIRGTTGLGVTRDRWGVERVVRLRFRPVPQPPA